MPISLLPKFFFIFLLSTIIGITSFTNADSQCLDSQKTLLLEFKNELTFNSSVSRKLVLWNQTDDCCSWEGVECDGAGHVISLQLDNESISGGIQNSSSLFSLGYLEKLNLAYNDFNGTQIPRGIHNLTYLTHLNLSNAGFGGQVPVELSSLRGLVSLDVSSAYPYVQLLKLEYPNLKMLLQNLSRLKEIYLDRIPISAPGSEWGHIISSSLPDLRNLSLRRCNLSGPLDPSLRQLHSLSILLLDGNSLWTAVPDFFANFSSLTTLSLSRCSLTGSFPELIFEVPTLQNLDLSENQLLRGTIPQFSRSASLRSIALGQTNFSGTLPDSLGNLSMLSYIDMSSCRFMGPIPSTMTNLTKLVYVDLSANFLTGSIPPFYKSKKLAQINLGGNSLTGSLSSMHFEGLSDLFGISLEYNSLSGRIPESLFGLPSLQRLTLFDNQFSGQVREFPTAHPSNMDSLDLSNNQLEGPIPESLFYLENLEDLWLSNNLFNGTFQLEKIQRLRNLVRLGLSYNKLSVDASNINSSLYGFPKLHKLYLASCNLYDFPDFLKRSHVRSLDLSNNQISGEIPSWIWEIGNGKLYYLNLSSNLLVDLQKPFRFPTSLGFIDLQLNRLTGELPPLPEYAYSVDYSNNNFDKPIPLDIGNFTSSDLVFFSLANNSLSGSIPTFLCNSTNLHVLDLSFSNFSGHIPPCLFENMEYLQVLKLGNNNITGDIPDKFRVDCDLRILDLSSNILGGNIPMSLANCKWIEVLNVGNNNINDSFPCMLPSSLRVLVLRSNRFHGEVRCHNSWPNLQIIDVASNNFSGNLHTLSFSSWGGMMLNSDAQLRRTILGIDITTFVPNYYLIQVTLTIKGSEHKLLKILGGYASIDFSCNNFEGEIPDAIGDLKSLYLLNLSHNALTGTIPKRFGNLTELGSLDISINQLTGEIPVELARLTFLSVLNLSFNKLVGAIPNGPQFQTFSAGSFEGNAGLCGFPLNVSCSNNNRNDSSPTAQPHGKKEIEWDYVSAALGYVVGLGSFLWLLLCCQRLRRKYFEKVDEILEKIFGRRDKKRRRGRRALRNQVRRP